MPKLLYIPLNKIRQNPVALRNVNRDSAEFQEITDSVRANGIMNPITVRERKSDKDSYEYEIVDGLQRFSAATEAGTGVLGSDKKPSYEKDEKSGQPIIVNGQPVGLIPAQIIEKDDAEVLITQVITNAQKIETRGPEYAKQCMRILGYHPTWSLNELAARLSKSAQWLEKTMSLTKLNEKIQPLVSDGKISLVNAYALAQLPPEEQVDWVDRASTMDSAEFTAQANKRVKDIRAANRKGSDPEAEQFHAVRHARNKKEIEVEADRPTIIPALIREYNILKDVPANATGLLQAAVAGAKLALDWAMNFDPKSIEAQRAKYESFKKQQDAQKQQRNAERAIKKEEELAKKAAEARKAADEARKSLPQGATAPAAAQAPAAAAAKAAAPAGAK